MFYAAGLPLKAGASGGLPITAGGTGGEQAFTDNCKIVVGGEGGTPLVVGDTALTLGDFNLTCGGDSTAVGVWVPDPTGTEIGMVNAVIVDPGQKYLSSTVQTTLDVDPSSPTYGQTTTTDVVPNPLESYDGEVSYVTQLDQVRVKNSGMGYSPGDTATVVSTGGSGPAGAGGTGTGTGTGGAEVTLQIQDGFIVNATVVSNGSGFTELPEIQINSNSGVGARLLPVLKFIKVPEAEKKATESPRNVELVTVIDCV